MRGSSPASNATARPWLSFWRQGASKKTVRDKTVAAAARRGDPVVFFSAMQLDTEADAPHHGTAVEFCGVRNTSVSSGRSRSRRSCWRHSGRGDV